MLISQILQFKKNHEIKVMQKISVAKITVRENYVKHRINNQERMSLLPLSVLQNVCKSKST